MVTSTEQLTEIERPLLTPDLEQQLEPMDAILILGRGISDEGELSQTGKDRAEAAARLLLLGKTDTLIFSGGHSWQQEQEYRRTGKIIPSEADAMMRHAIQYLGETYDPRIMRIYAETKSTNTVENFVYSKQILADLGLLDPDKTIGVMSDELHFREERIQLYGGLTIPGMHKIILRLPNAEDPTEAKAKEEQKVTQLSRLAMVGVRRGGENAVRRRMRLLTAANNIRQILNSGRQQNLDFSTKTAKSNS